MLRMRRKPRVDHAFYFPVRLQKLRHCHPIQIVAVHAHGKRLKSTRNQKAIHRRETGSSGPLHEIYFFGVFGTRKDHRAADAITVAIQVFRHRVDDDMRPQRDGLLQIRAEECVVHYKRQISFARELRHGRQVCDYHRRIRRRFDIHHFRVWFDGGLHFFEARSVHVAEFHPKLDEQLSRQPENSAVHCLGQDGVIAGTQKPEDGVDRRHSGGEHISGVASL